MDKACYKGIREYSFQAKIGNEMFVLLFFGCCCFVCLFFASLLCGTRQGNQLNLVLHVRYDFSRPVDRLRRIIYSLVPYENLQLFLCSSEINSDVPRNSLLLNRPLFPEIPFYVPLITKDIPHCSL